ncbi:MAG: hypothetical protein RMZ41_001470 [Nostoc sp. DedVER02]|uniref:hypothetical protein n=1 Tax=unclassified Nostoc TaxID=2593658 RepID=UPI002AD1D36D|nr:MULTISPECIES: hypothetical protein [unclassified Nostoc]MDZ7987169.1 hypothetical protein [Nostoc sp. DedVER02]MDZ8110960.1 hypothetical protein [Nostoc sp. DedVER01b]
MLRYTKYILGTTFVFISIFTVVYAAVSREVKQDKVDVVYRITRAVKSDRKSENLLLVSENKDSTDIAEKSDLQKVDWEKTFALFPDFVDRKMNTSLFASLDNSNLSNAARAAVSSLEHNEKQIDQFTDTIRTLVKNSKRFLNYMQKNYENTDIIPVSYTINAQLPTKQKIDTNLYIDIRTKVIYLETFLDTLKVVKQSEKSIHSNQIDQLTLTQLEKNIKESSNYIILTEQFNNNIPKEWRLLAEHEREYVKFVQNQIELAGKIPDFETSVTNIMLKEERSKKWANQIAQQVKQELDNQAIRALW